MEIEIKKEVDNKSLGRREIFAEVSYKGKTPSKDEVKEEICKRKNLNPEATVVVKIEQLYGRSVSSVIVHSYSSKEAMRAEHEYLIKRASKKEAKGAGDAKEAAQAQAAHGEGKESGAENASGTESENKEA
ncbi:MAG: hypothetical protein QW774_03755 [Candidatus Micrarchaeaceae archaeon]